MAAVDIGARNVPPVPAADDLDDLFNYDVGGVFRDVDTNIDIPTQPKPAVHSDGKENVVGLGIDEEIKVAKKRAPVPKLDESRLLGPAGIPKLRRITKDRLRFKGKGHEYSDVTRLLNVFQLWLDELYPRAKFADGLAIIEKLGHTKRMQTMRREWINEGKPTERLDSAESRLEKQATTRPNSRPSNNHSMMAKPSSRSQTPAFDENEDRSNSAAAKLIEVEGPLKRDQPSTESLFVSDDEDQGDQPPEDDLDALLAQDRAKSTARTTAPLPDTHTGRRDDDFDDEMEAMAAMDDMW